MEPKSKLSNSKCNTNQRNINQSPEHEAETKQQSSNNCNINQMNINQAAKLRQQSKQRPNNK